MKFHINSDYHFTSPAFIRYHIKEMKPFTVQSPKTIPKSYNF